jgi:hypothetical protein
LARCFEDRCESLTRGCGGLESDGCFAILLRSLSPRSGSSVGQNTGLSRRGSRVRAPSAPPLIRGHHTAVAFLFARLARCGLPRSRFVSVHANIWPCSLDAALFSAAPLRSRTFRLRSLWFVRDSLPSAASALHVSWARSSQVEKPSTRRCSSQSSGRGAADNKRLHPSSGGWRPSAMRCSMSGARNK